MNLTGRASTFTSREGLLLKVYFVWCKGVGEISIRKLKERSCVFFYFDIGPAFFRTPFGVWQYIIMFEKEPQEMRDEIYIVKSPTDFVNLLLSSRK